MQKVVIMGAGPAGIAAGYRLVNADIETVLLEKESYVGGISKTVNFDNYYFDLGGHRFFTKFDEVNEFWSQVLGQDDFRTRPRLSRIYYKNKFFNYPIKPLNALIGMGFSDSLVVACSYVKAKLFPYKKEKTFEEWVTNRFGSKLYSVFFKTYTEKVWGIPCSRISAEWAAQRIKGLSLFSAFKNAILKGKGNQIKTLIDEFKYPVYGPGMMYNRAKQLIENKCGQVRLNSKVIGVKRDKFKITAVEYFNENGEIVEEKGSHFISSIPITELITLFDPLPEKEVVTAASKLKYRSFITVGVVVNKKHVFPDNWIYVHSPEVMLGRIQNFKNWSPDMCADPEKTNLGLEYFCTEDDELWNMADEEIYEIACSDLQKLNMASRQDIESFMVHRVPKAYPVYMQGYNKHLSTIKEYVRKFTNLELVGRYGMFKYNNMDHSIITGLYAADNILGIDSHNIWDVNTDEEYHEEKTNTGIRR